MFDNLTSYFSHYIFPGRSDQNLSQLSPQELTSYRSMKELSEKVDEALRNGVECGERSINQLTRNLAMPPLAVQTNRPARQSSPSPQSLQPQTTPSPLALPPQPVQEQLQRKRMLQQEEAEQNRPAEKQQPPVTSRQMNFDTTTKSDINLETNVSLIKADNVEEPRNTDAQSEVNLFPLAQQLLYYGIVVFCVYKLTGWLHIRPTFGDPTEQHSFLYRLLVILFHWIFGW